jgi:hypothetical protein
MTVWTNEELNAIATAEELGIASLRKDGTLRDPVTIWVVRHGDDLYIRSVNGPDSSWFRGTHARERGRISAGGVEKDVSFERTIDGVEDQIDAAYRSKYSHYSENTLRRITSPEARSTTIKLVPRS